MGFDGDSVDTNTKRLSTDDTEPDRVWVLRDPASSQAEMLSFD
jgi:hypothetical protein